MRWLPSARPGGASYALKPEPARPRGAAGMILINRTWFRILAQWLHRMMNCSAVGRGHRRSWSLPGNGVAHLLCWERHERDGSWHAWVSIRVQSTGDPVRHRHHVVSVRADAVRRLENPAAYARVPRRVLGSDGRIRSWTAAGPITRGAHDPG